MGIVEDAVEQLRERILNASDSVLPSQSILAQELGISRTAVREAMTILQAQGWIEIQQGKRPQILPVSNSTLSEQLRLFMSRQGASFHQFMEVRLPIETEVARIAAQRATEDQLDTLHSAIERLRSAKRLEEQVKADRDFHVGLAHATHNPLFVSILESFHFGLQSSMKTTIGNKGVQNAVRGHRAILDAVSHHQPDLAANRMQRHLKQAIRDFKNPAKRAR
jgi:DNA-binding FadR family transcriptional regulator